jgi:hypothetical protein
MALGDGNRTLKEDAQFIAVAEEKARPNIKIYFEEYKWILLLIGIVIIYSK